METPVSTSITRRSAVAGLTLTVASVAILSRADKADAQEKSLYERLGGVFAIAAVVDHFSDAVVKNPIVGEKSQNPQLREWHTKNLEGCPASSSCGRCGSAKFRAGLSSSRLPSPARRRSALKRHIGTSGSRPQNSMRSQRNSGGPWTSSRSRSARRLKSWQRSPPTKTKSLLDTSRPLSEFRLSKKCLASARKLTSYEVRLWPGKNDSGPSTQGPMSWLDPIRTSNFQGNRTLLLNAAVVFLTCRKWSRSIDPNCLG